MLSSILCSHCVWTTPLDCIDFSFLEYFACVNRPKVYYGREIVIYELWYPLFCILFLLRVFSVLAMLLIKLQFLFDSSISV